jgi:hypothetical protein
MMSSFAFRMSLGSLHNQRQLALAVGGREWRLSHRASETGAIPSNLAASLRLAEMWSTTTRNVAFSISGSEVPAHSITHRRSSAVKQRSGRRGRSPAMASAAYSWTILGNSNARSLSGGT